MVDPEGEGDREGVLVGRDLADPTDVRVASAQAEQPRRRRNVGCRQGDREVREQSLGPLRAHSLGWEEDPDVGCRYAVRDGASGHLSGGRELRDVDDLDGRAGEWSSGGAVHEKLDL